MRYAVRRKEKIGMQIASKTNLKKSSQSGRGLLARQLLYNSVNLGNTPVVDAVLVFVKCAAQLHYSRLEQQIQ